MLRFGDLLGWDWEMLSVVWWGLVIFGEVGWFIRVVLGNWEMFYEVWWVWVSLGDLSWWDCETLREVWWLLLWLGDSLGWSWEMGRELWWVYNWGGLVIFCEVGWIIRMRLKNVEWGLRKSGMIGRVWYKWIMDENPYEMFVEVKLNKVG